MRGSAEFTMVALWSSLGGEESSPLWPTHTHTHTHTIGCSVSPRVLVHRTLWH